MRLRAYGEDAVLADLDGPDDVLPLLAALRAVPGVVELVPGARTLLVAFEPDLTSSAAIRAAIDTTDLRARPPVVGEVVELPVRYDGADLDAVAAECGFDRDEVIARHLAPEYTVAFCGFAPGFAYLTGLDPALHVARLDEPRTSVPAGAVAIAGEFAGVYPRASPGGWRLLGHTDTALWDLERTPPALLAPGTRVRFASA